MEIEQEWYRVYCRDPFPNARLSVGAQQLPFSVSGEKVQAKTLHLHIVPAHNNFNFRTRFGETVCQPKELGAIADSKN